VLGLPAEGPAACHGACWKVLVAMAAGVCGRGVEGLPYKSAGRSPPNVIIEASGIDGQRRWPDVASMPR
jgi:hypothetical protein